MECILALLAWSMAIGGLRWIFTLRNPLFPGEAEWAPLHRDHLRNLLVAVVGFGAFPILAGCVWGDGFIKGFRLLAVNGIGLVRDAQGKRREALLARERDEQTQLRLMLSMFGFLVMFSGLAVVWVSTL
jgi:hypothetical protein